jgi:predicted small metal-binding protein
LTQVVDCPCGTQLVGQNDDEIVSQVEAHVQDEHPEMVGTMSREQILEMAQPA